MKNSKCLIFLLAANILLSASAGLAETKYRELLTSKGKVILGLDRMKAYQTFGPPASRGEGLWYYNSPSEFFVSFSDKPSILLFPAAVEGFVGIPLEFKVFLILPDAEIREITQEVQLAFDQPSCAKIASPGVIMPKKTGQYSALAIYNELLSNPLALEIKQAEGTEQQGKEKLVGIDLLPYRPTATPEGLIDFLALGTFFDVDLNRYSVRDISQKAVWLMRLRPRLTWDQQEANRIYFFERGKEAEVAAEYEEVRSYIQRVQLKDQPDPNGSRLKHILVLPEVMVVMLDNSLGMRAFGTYYNNNIEELTPSVQWRVSNQKILESHKNGYFFAREEGVTEVTASKDGVESLPVKVIVTNKSSPGGVSSSFGSRQSDDPDSLLMGIQENVNKLKKDFLVDKKELKTILVTPKLIEIGLGEESKLFATGIYDDGSSSDVTVLGEWHTLNPAIAKVSAGNVSTVSVGQTNAFVEFKGVRSEYARINVGGPRLVELVLTPENLKISRDGKAKLKVVGNYYDKSQRNLTELVTWSTLGAKPCVKVDKGEVRALKFGQSEVVAEYSFLKSNPSHIKVILTLGWLLWLLAKILLILLLILLSVFTGLYLAVDNQRRRLRALQYDPRRMIIELYENATRLVTIFGLRYDAYTFPLFYAALARKKFALENNVFLNFCVKYEEAKYSKHILGHRDLASVLNDYNNFFEKLCKDQRRSVTLYRHCLALLHRRPIFILSSSEVTAA